jgi:hypothetical protein
MSAQEGYMAWAETRPRFCQLVCIADSVKPVDVWLRIKEKGQTEVFALDFDKSREVALAKFAVEPTGASAQASTPIRTEGA